MEMDKNKKVKLRYYMFLFFLVYLGVILAWDEILPFLSRILMLGSPLWFDTIVEIVLTVVLTVATSKAFLKRNKRSFNRQELRKIIWSSSLAVAVVQFLYESF